MPSGHLPPPPLCCTGSPVGHPLCPVRGLAVNSASSPPPPLSLASTYVSHMGPGKSVLLGGTSERCPSKTGRWERRRSRYRRTRGQMVHTWQQGVNTSSARGPCPGVSGDLLGLLHPLLQKPLHLLPCINTFSAWVPEQTL